MPILADILVSLPAGTVIFMSGLLASTLLRKNGLSAAWLDLFLLALAAGAVGLLLALVRKKRGLLTALFSGCVAALFLFYLSLASPDNAAINPWLFGLPGMLVAIVFSLLGARLLRHRDQ